MKIWELLSDFIKEQMKKPIKEIRNELWFTILSVRRKTSCKDNDDSEIQNKSRSHFQEENKKNIVLNGFRRLTLSC